MHESYHDFMLQHCENQYKALHICIYLCELKYDATCNIQPSSEVTSNQMYNINVHSSRTVVLTHN